MKEVIVTLNDISSDEAFSKIKVNPNDKIYIKLSQNDMVNLFLTIRRERMRDEADEEKRIMRKMWAQNMG